MIPQTTWKEKTIVSTCIIVFCLIMVFFAYGVWAAIFSVPTYKAQSKYYKNRAEVWHSRAVELEKAVEDYQAAMNYEKLFLLIAKPDSIMLLGDLEERIKNKAGFCLEAVE